jgi:AraC-like DNA-binding protein
VVWRGLQRDPAQLGELGHASLAPLVSTSISALQWVTVLMPITEIALSWDFNNLSHFSHVFREHTGKSQSEFRSQTQEAPLTRLQPD